MDVHRLYISIHGDLGIEKDSMTLAERLEELHLARIAVMEDVKKHKQDYGIGFKLVDERVLQDLLRTAREVVE